MTALSIVGLVLFGLAAALGLGLAAGVLWLVWQLVKLVVRLVVHVLDFARRELVDSVQVAGAVFTGAAMAPLVAINFALLRMGAARHYARSIGDEVKSAGVGLWRVALGNPLRLCFLGGVVDHVERRLPDAMERSPRSRRARRATFEGYDVVGTLPSGGSGAQLFVARPRAATQKRFLAQGRALPREVVIKSFALEAGSTLPQIVRESRALEAASRLGLVCEHQLSADHFYYVMPYVKGEDLDRVVRGLHAQSSPEGLGPQELALVLGYATDLLDHLGRFHAGGLWHKDVKPANILVASGRAHLVDFGLVTPLASAMTLTTHGTEYYRDPEMVRLALQGVKVHEVDGVRFDIYSAGAVLYTMIENSFPAHGSLSAIGKRCPEALRWIVQRAMGEMKARYASAGEMRADLAALAAARDPFELKPADLPSFGRTGSFVADRPAHAQPEPAIPAFAPTFEPAPEGRACAFRGRRGRRRMPSVALATVGLFGLFLSTLGFFTSARQASAVTAERLTVRTASAERPEWMRGLPERERKLVELAQGVVEDLGEAEPTPLLDRGVDPVETSPTPASAEDVDRTAEEILATESGAAPPSSDEPPVSASAPRGRVLVLEDLNAPADSKATAQLCGKLAERGFEVVGDEADPDAAARAVELLASARHALGIGTADEAETQVALQRFLDATPELDALIVLSQDADGPGASAQLYRVFTRRQ